MTSISSTSTPSSSDEAATGTLSPEQIALTIKDIAKKMRAESARMRETTRIIHTSGAIEELTDAVKGATMAARDTSIEINEAMRELKEHGVIRDAAMAVDEVARNARETVQTVSTISEEARQAAPETAAAIERLPNRQRRPLRSPQKRQKKR